MPGVTDWVEFWQKHGKPWKIHLSPALMDAAERQGIDVKAFYREQWGAEVGVMPKMPKA